MSKVSEMLQSRRKELGLTLEEVGNAIGVNKATVYLWESGITKSMRICWIVPLAKALKIDLVDFVYAIKQEYEG